jgi:1-acyl-sn-glycerol-3-phosphate acyltransferase
MGYAVQWVRSLLFVLQMYVAMAVLAIAFLPAALVSLAWTYRAMHLFCWWVRWTADWMVGLRSEVRGTPPTDEVLVAAKHQSFLDIILIFGSLPRPKFIMKKELRWAPFLGWYAQRIGCILVDRGKRGAAIAKMVEDVSVGRGLPGQLIIYPQGTRVAPGAQKTYKVGTGVLYEALGHDCVPVATNVGVFWPRRGIYRKPGLAIVEFLPRIKAGRPPAAFMKSLEEVIETGSDRLMADAGFVAGAARGG